MLTKVKIFLLLVDKRNNTYIFFTHLFYADKYGGEPNKFDLNTYIDKNNV